MLFRDPPSRPAKTVCGSLILSCVCDARCRRLTNAARVSAKIKQRRTESNRGGSRIDGFSHQPAIRSRSRKIEMWHVILRVCYWRRSGPLRCPSNIPFGEDRPDLPPFIYHPAITGVSLGSKNTGTPIVHLGLALDRKHHRGVWVDAHYIQRESVSTDAAAWPASRPISAPSPAELLLQRRQRRGFHGRLAYTKGGVCGGRSNAAVLIGGTKIYR